VIGHLGSDPHEMSETLAVWGAAGVRFDALKQRHSLFGARHIDLLEASAHCETCEHGAPLPRFERPSWNSDVKAWGNGFKMGSQAGPSEVHKHSAEGKRYFLVLHLLNVGGSLDNSNINGKYGMFIDSFQLAFPSSGYDGA
jgi:hypothetical protein